jgi:uncharacterized membrane protein
MDFLDWILVAIRLGHALAAVAWVGGGMFYLLVLRPSFQCAPPGQETRRNVAAEFRSLVSTAIGALLISGVILSVSRLTSGAVGIFYVAVLAVKIALALYMFYGAWTLRRQTGLPEEGLSQSWWARLRRRLTSATAILIAGIVVFGLADLLDALFESGLGR